MEEEKAILFLEPSAERACLAYQRMNDRDKNRTIWCRTAQEAIDVLNTHKDTLDQVFLEHDLERKNQDSRSETSGMEVVRWLEDQIIQVQARYKSFRNIEFVIHSWNLERAKAMNNRLLDKKLKSCCKPFGM